MDYSEYIGSEPKKVIYQSAFFVNSEINGKEHLPKIWDIIKKIESGESLDGYYRPSMGTVEDPLLKERGWIHLHVDCRPGQDDVLLFVEQQGDRVILIGVGTHEVFDVFKDSKTTPFDHAYPEIKKARNQRIPVKPAPQQPPAPAPAQTQPSVNPVTGKKILKAQPGTKPPNAPTMQSAPKKPKPPPQNEAERMRRSMDIIAERTPL